MTRTQLQACACGLAALGLVVGGAVASRAQQPPEPGAKQRGKQEPPKDDRDAEIAALKKEVESLRRQVEALTKKDGPRPERQKVVVTTPVVKDVSIPQVFTAKIRAQRHIDLRARMAGTLSEVTIKEGQAVKQGDVLFKVSPTLYQAKLEAERAVVKVAEVELSNVKKLSEQKVVSQQEVAVYTAKLAEAQARAKIAEAELMFTEVRAPFGGYVGRLHEQAGSLVKDGDSLTTLTDNSQVWVYFDVPEARYLDYRANPDQIKTGTPVELLLVNGEKFPQAGKLGAIEATFQDAGTIAFRADFPNPDHLLCHGQTGTVVMRESLKGAVVIPQRATFEKNGRRYVFVVGKDDVARQRAITIQSEFADHFVVKRGLEASDRIVVDGVRQVRDGEKVEYEFRRPEEVVANPAGR